MKGAIALGICAAILVGWRLTKPTPLPREETKIEADEEIDFIPPDAADTERIQRITKKHHVVSAIMAGELSLAAAVHRFEELILGNEEAVEMVRRIAIGETDQERLANQVLTHAHPFQTRDRDTYTVRWAQLESEAKWLMPQPIQIQ